MLARIFMARADIAYSVRTAAVHVWKTVVVNTPRTTTEILPVLMNHLIEALGSPGANCLQCQQSHLCLHTCRSERCTSVSPGGWQHSNVSWFVAPLTAVEECREMSATCIGELVRKMGERVLHKILPILQVRHHTSTVLCPTGVKALVS